MFNKARLKLTAWYLAIIMVVSLAFSLVIYKVLTVELDRFSRLQQIRIERQFQGNLPFAPDAPRFGNTPFTALVIDPELIAETRQRLLFILAIVNGGILIVSGGLGYFLAGRTLKPIQAMVDEQNQFITDASHELKTPLTSLKTALEVHRRDKQLDLKTAKTLIDESIDEVNKLQSLSEGLLQLAQYQKPNNHGSFEQVSLVEIIKKSIQKIKPQALARHITIIDKSKDFQFRGDPYGLTDLLVILLDNAVKYSQKGKLITITSSKTDGSLSIAIADQGIGIDKKDLPHIFDRFYRSDTARSKNGTGGYGLGLSIAKKIVEVHHGTVTVESKSGKGSTFTVVLPLFS